MFVHDCFSLGICEVHYIHEVLLQEQFDILENRLIYFLAKT